MTTQNQHSHLDKSRANFHYEEEARFYRYSEMGYSGNFWEKGATTNSEAALHKYEILEGLIKPKGRMLEIGCGRGDFAVWMKDRHPKVELDAIDISKSNHEAAKTKGSDVNFMHMHFYDLQEGAYDRIYSDEMMVHVPDNYKFFKHCRKLLKPGGIMVHKEVHKTHFLSIPYFRCRSLNKPFDMSGRYSTKRADLRYLKKLGFDTTLHAWDIQNYVYTLRSWVVNMEADKEELIRINEEKYWRDRALWYRFLSILAEDRLELNIMVSTR
jgi:cyclopropane fatty-acyl-phospholipid synthase-like methyltransferase